MNSINRLDVNLSKNIRKLTIYEIVIYYQNLAKCMGQHKPCHILRLWTWDLHDWEMLNCLLNAIFIVTHLHRSIKKKQKIYSDRYFNNLTIIVLTQNL